jgi:hypothetical protein
VIKINLARGFGQTILYRWRQAAKIAVVKVGEGFQRALRVELRPIDRARGGKRGR